MYNLCKYRDFFGKPGLGIHKYRVFDVAIVDIIVVIISAWFISYWFETPFWLTFVILSIVGIIAHRLFCVRTTIDKLLFTQ